MADATHDWAEQVDCDMRMDYLISRAEAEADKQLAVAAALREAAEFVQTMQDRRQIVWAKDILALIPDAGAALDRALAAQRERDAKVAERPMLPCDLGGDLILDPYTAETIAAAIRHGSAISALGPSDLKNNRGKT